MTFWLSVAAKEKDVAPPEEEEEDIGLDEKRHLNVVFIGHVGK